MQPFSFATAAHLICEPGAVQRLVPLCQAWGARSVVLVTDAGIARQDFLTEVRSAFANGGVALHVFDGVVAGAPENVIDEAAQFATDVQANLVIGFGGGSSMDVAKLVAQLAHPDCQQTLSDLYGIDKASGQRLPLIQVPTTAGSGSEVTPIAVVTTKHATRVAVVSARLLPDLALLDAELTLHLPSSITAACGMLAMGHAVEAYTGARRKNPLSDMLAREALRLLGASLDEAVSNGANREARQAMLLGACLAGQAYANAPLAAVHALAYPLGGHCQVPHGVSTAVLLPHVLGFNASVAAPLYEELAPLLLGERLRDGDATDRTEQFIIELADLSERNGLPGRLRDLSVEQALLPRLAADAMLHERLLVNNPREMTQAHALAIYQVAY
ncbi:iron-containing alcohol dehydrogenase [Pseudomonas argentinensis]|uniref:Alcohol dehydrogenase n=1 Tax=Phytopseudomonas argentinensis TaxID=289370 RepID=A0A1I3HZR0_9GAMM|nr:iron-containing alcohol dehydrogenase [Pseudomonas argentinensis]KAB0548030.1 iron-containing alcohol dehydrogenase [Pseudomonas argentinensis]SFI41204.1 alcohol dehydrogenase [Pseudomonas argentinensis]